MGRVGTMEEVGGTWVLMGSGGRRPVAVLCLGLLAGRLGSYGVWWEVE